MSVLTSSEDSNQPTSWRVVARVGVQTLSAREREIFALLGDGLDNRSIARRLGVGERTVKFHLTSIIRKLGVTSRLQVGLVASDCLRSRPFPHT